MEIVQIIVLAVLFLALAALCAIELEHAGITDYELDRLAKKGDAQAQASKQREQTLPLLEVLRNLLELTVGAFIVVVAVAVGSWLLGTLFGVMLIVAARLAAHSSFAKKQANNYYQRYEGRIIQQVAKMPWLNHLADAKSPQSLTASSREDLLNIAQHSKGVLTGDELVTLKSFLNLPNVTVADVMTPKSVIDSVPVSETVGPLVLDQLHKTGHSRFPVTDGDIDHIVGMLYMHDLVDMRRASASAQKVMQPKVHYIRQDQTLEHALHAFLKTHHHLFVVVNEYRETVGLLSLEDVLESLLGRKIMDEFDAFDDLRAVAANNPRQNNQPKGKQDV